MITVRPALPADASAMSALLIASITELCTADHENRPDALNRWLGNKTPEGVLQWFDNPDNRLFVVERYGVVAAVGAFNVHREVILNYVSPLHRFRGASKALLGAMEEALGPGEAMLTSTKTAHRFYLAQGWADTGEIDREGGMVAYPMRKTL